MGKHQQAFAEFMERLRKTIYESRIKRENNEEFLKRLAKNTKQRRQENEKAMGSSDTGVYVDMALEHERKLKKTRAKRRVSKRADAEARRARPSKTQMEAYNVGTKCWRKKPKMKRKIIER